MDDSTPTKIDRLPIKLILPRQGKEKKVQSGGKPPVPLRPVDNAFRNSLLNEVSAINEVLRPSIKETGAIPMRVKLHTKALAKSHRPDQLFSSDTCPIVGAGRLGELFVKATPKGLVVCCVGKYARGNSCGNILDAHGTALVMLTARNLGSNAGLAAGAPMWLAIAGVG